jgi:hypothetical protein
MQELLQNTPVLLGRTAVFLGGVVTGFLTQTARRDQGSAQFVTQRGRTKISVDGHGLSCE